MKKLIASALTVLGVLLMNTGTSRVYAQSASETQLRQEFERRLNELRAEFDRKLNEAVEREVARSRQENISQEVKTSVKQALEAQAPAALLAPAPMPPSAAGMGLFFNIELGGTNFWGVETPFAAAATGRNSTIPFGKWKSVDVDRGFSQRPELGYYLPNGNGIISGSYFHASASGRAKFSNSNGIIGPGNIDPFNEEGVEFASAKNSVQLHQADLQYLYPVQLTKTFTLTPEFGLRYVSFNNKVRISTDDELPPDGDSEFDLKFVSKSQGGGPKIGLGGAWELMKDWILSVKGSGGYLLGVNRASRLCKGQERCNSENNTPPQASINDKRGFPFVDGDFSLTYRTPVNGLSAAVGYRLTSYFEMTTRMRDLNGALFSSGSPGSRQDVFEHKNLTYDSIYFKLQYLW